ncbi:hypothetical protein GE09DRAFT_1245468 [Coniochaeta sp. 2T2.1]|nr:hypothetical protein GE09DRAFT_1245468 [Coniochaeta sp. 2T2.1]
MHARQVFDRDNGRPHTTTHHGISGLGSEASGSPEPSLSEDDLVEVEHSASEPEDVAPRAEQESKPDSSPKAEETEPKPESAPAPSKEDQEPTPAPAPEPRKVTKPGEPAYVAPIPKIGPISPVSPISHPLGTPPTRPPLPKFVGSFLVGRTVDEAGDIVDSTTGQVLARAAGDLPSIVGRKVSNSKGDILGDDGELLGWVADLEIDRKGSNASGGLGSPPPPTSPLGAGMAGMRSLAEMMGRANASLMVDHMGNILDAGGSVVGKFHDNNNPAHRKEREEQERAKAAALQAAADRAVRRAVKQQEAERKAAEEAGDGEEVPEGKKQQQAEDEGEEHEPECSCSKGKRKPRRRTEEERRENAAAWRKEKPGESPSDIFLDVKSTTEGIQLTIRIPTVFNGQGQQVKPTVQFT